MSTIEGAYMDFFWGGLLLLSLTTSTETFKGLTTETAFCFLARKFSIASFLFSSFIITEDFG
jgi:hypothetical protein